MKDDNIFRLKSARRNGHDLTVVYDSTTDSVALYGSQANAPFGTLKSDDLDDFLRYMAGDRTARNRTPFVSWYADRDYVRIQLKLSLYGGKGGHFVTPPCEARLMSNIITKQRKGRAESRAEPATVINRDIITLDRTATIPATPAPSSPTEKLTVWPNALIKMGG